MAELFREMTSRFRLGVTRLVARLISEHIRRIREAAYREGEIEGWKKGQVIGKEEGFAEGRLVYDVIEAPPLEAKEVDAGLYGPALLGDAVTAAKMRQDVAAKVNAGLIKAPTQEQWEMILTDHPATCVSAGAGSGKSTTLVLRVVYMLEYLKIPDQEITVISFTVNSCDELRGKLIKIMSFWRPNVSEQEWKAWSKEKVRTFHSLLHRMAQSELPGRFFFELIKKGEADQFLEDTASGDIENPASGSRLNEVQVTLLAEAYRSLFCSDTDFRQAILELLRMELASKPRGGSEPIKPGLVYYSAERDADVIKRSNQNWMGNGWPFEGIVEESIELANLSGGKKFFSNGVHRSTKKPVVLGFAPGMKKAEKDRGVGIGKAKTAFAAALAARTRILANHAQKDYIYIKDEATLEAYLIWDKYIAQSEGDPQKSYVPMFKVKLDGEIKPILIYESLFAQGSFVETLGMDVVALLRKIPAPQRIDATVHFYRALGRYWPHLNEFLRSKKLHTFNRAFLMLSRSSQLSKLSTSAPSAMRHLLVDEFQDISPLIVSWLKSAQRTLLEQDQVAGVSIMAIGDDWQSIYGWRGSSPQLFIDFNRHFPVHTSLCSFNQLLFRENFRSVSAIVVDAARLINRIQKKVTKECISKIKAQAGDHGVKLMTYGDAEGAPSNEQSAETLVPFIESEYKAALSGKGSNPELVLVMTRSGKMRELLSHHLPGKNFPGLKVCTYHQAKGLEADTAILIEDCWAEVGYSLRNLFYAASGLYGCYTYDAAARDEALRLGYVGVTRGRKKVFWQVPKFSYEGAASIYRAS